MISQVNLSALERKIAKIFHNLSLSESQSYVIINNLISSELLGKRTHGLILLSHIIPALINKPRTALEWTWKDSHLHCNAHNHLGYLVVGEAINKICIKAKEDKTVAFATLAKISHAGRLGHYTYEIAKNGLTGIIFAHSNPWVAAPEGNKAILGSVAFSASIPFTSPPIIIDFTPNLVTAGEVRIKALTDQEFDTVIGIDSEGNYTKDPKKVLQGGALHTIGQHKGFVIALLISIISTMIGGDAIANMKDGYGYTVIAIHPDYLGTDNYIERCQELIKAVIESGDSIHLPGEKYLLLNEQHEIIEVEEKIIDFIDGISKLDCAEDIEHFVKEYDMSVNEKK